MLRLMEMLKLSLYNFIKGIIKHNAKCNKNKSPNYNDSCDFENVLICYILTCVFLKYFGKDQRYFLSKVFSSLFLSKVCVWYIII